MYCPAPPRERRLLFVAAFGDRIGGFSDWRWGFVCVCVCVVPAQGMGSGRPSCAVCGGHMIWAEFGAESRRQLSLPREVLRWLARGCCSVSFSFFSLAANLGAQP